MLQKGVLITGTLTPGILS